MNTTNSILRLPLLPLALAGIATGLRAELDADQQAKVNAKIEIIKS